MAQRQSTRETAKRAATPGQKSVGGIVAAAFTSLMADQDKSKTELLSSLTTARNRIASLRGDTEAATRRAVNGLMVVSGGGLVGMIRGWTDGPGYIPGTEIPWETATAVGFAVVGVLDGAGDYSDELGSVGAGMGAAIAAPAVEKAITAMRKN